MKYYNICVGILICGAILLIFSAGYNSHKHQEKVDNSKQSETLNSAINLIQKQANQLTRLSFMIVKYKKLCEEQDKVIFEYIKDKNYE